MTKLVKRLSIAVLAVLMVVAFVLPGAPTASAQTTTTVYDYAWLQSIASQEDAIDQVNQAWETRTGDQWRAGDGEPGVYDIVANSVVIGSMTAGNDPAFHSLAPNLWYTPEGGRFGTSEGYRAFQLDGAVHATSIKTTPANVAQVVAQLASYQTYGQKINFLDVLWTGNNVHIVNRWGSSGWKELLSATQQDMLKNAGQRPAPLMQKLPGDVVIWGELCANPNPLWGLAKISENIYKTTGNGGVFCTDRGFRAFQIK